MSKTESRYSCLDSPGDMGVKQSDAEFCNSFQVHQEREKGKKEQALVGKGKKRIFPRVENRR